MTRFFGVLLALLIFMPWGTHLKAAERLNLLLLTVDDMSADSIGVFGCKLSHTTPNIDRLAAEGLRFTRAHVVVGFEKWSGVPYFERLSFVNGSNHHRATSPIENLSPIFRPHWLDAAVGRYRESRSWMRKRADEDFVLSGCVGDVDEPATARRESGPAFVVGRFEERSRRPAVEVKDKYVALRLRVALVEGEISPITRPCGRKSLVLERRQWLGTPGSISRRDM